MLSPGGKFLCFNGKLPIVRVPGSVFSGGKRKLNGMKKNSIIELVICKNGDINDYVSVFG